MQRRSAVAALLASAASATLAHATARVGSPTELAQQRAERLARAEALLAAGRVADARDAFEQLAQAEHAADIELGILRCQMQAGEYRTALAFAAHAAGAHPQFSAGTAFYVWLLHLGGQHAVALKTLAQAEQRLPGDPALARMRALLGDGGLPVRAALEGDEALAAHQRLTPYALGPAVPADAGVIGAAILFGDRGRAIAPLAVVQGKTDLWLRNGLGRTTRARVSRTDPRIGLALLEADQSLDEVAAAIAGEEAPPGSPACAFGYPADSARNGAWPRTNLGFLGRWISSKVRLLGIDIATGTVGAPVVDLGGNVVGIVVPGDAGGKPRLAGVAAIRALLDEPPAAADSAPAANRPLDELYESAMRLALQVITLGS